MNCAEARRYLALTREGELSGDDERNLDAHLRSCPTCLAERDAFVHQNHLVEKLRSISPALPDPEANVQAVLARVRSETLPRPRGLAGALLDRIIGFLEVPVLRYALAVLIGAGRLANDHDGCAAHIVDQAGRVCLLRERAQLAVGVT